jgi:hypothetical protein
MRKVIVVFLVSLFSVLIFMSREAKAIDLTHSFVVGGDVGFYIDPTIAAWDIIGEYQITGNVAVGPMLSFGAAEDRFLFGASGFAKYKANLAENPKLKPYGLIGMGFLSDNKRHKDIFGGHHWKDNVRWLIPIGGGFEYWINDRLAFGATALFNVTDNPFFGLLFGLRTRF